MHPAGRGEAGRGLLGCAIPRPDAGSYILLTFDGRRSEVESALEDIRALTLRTGALEFIPLDDPGYAADIWKVRGALVKAVEAASEQEPVDIVVPISRTAEFIRFVRRTEAESGLRMVSFGHAGDGNVHLCVVRGDRSEEAWRTDLRAAMEKVYAKACELGGVPSGEHGIGLSKRHYFLRETAKENIAAMNRIKDALDPKHILNDQKSYISEGCEKNA
ncbi:MAG: FAD-linked oxidase C-terminal domain-containing protein [Acutalibacteraceae bacterium]